MKITIILGILLSYASSAYALFDCVKGTGDTVEINRALSKVSKVKMKASVDLLVRKSDRERLEIKGPKDLIDNLEIDTEGTQLSVGNDKCMSNRKSIQMVAYLKDLSQLSVLGASDISVVDSFSGEDIGIDIAGSGDVTGSFEAKFLSVSIKGSGDVKLKGKSEELKIDIMGSGDVSSLDLSAQKVTVSIKGAGDVEVKAIDTLDVQIFGSGDVKYEGRPKVDLAKYGSGSIRSL